MNVFRQRFLQSAMYGLIVSVFFGAVLALALPSYTVSAAEPRCFDIRSGALYLCPGNPNAVVDGQPGGHFAPDGCYALGDTEVGWISGDCEQDRFAIENIGKQPIDVNTGATSDECTKDATDKCDIIGKILNPIITFLAAAAGIVVTIVIIAGGIQYSAAGDDPQKVAAAKSKIINAVLALLGFIFLWAILQWIVPGGVFN